MMNENIDEYLNLLMEERGLGDNIPKDVRGRMKEDLSLRLNNFILAKALEVMPEEKIKELGAQADKSPEELMELFKNSIPNFQEFSVGVLLEFRQKYLR
jgi:hypothetical protein